jgi:UDP-N-acetylglucosamine kinase
VLSQEEHDKLRDLFADQRLDGTAEREKPKAVILAGQPGAGKTGLKRAAKAELSPNGGVVVVDTDELRSYHSAYPELIKKNDRIAADSVQKDAGQWAAELTRDAMENRRNLIVDGTLKNPDSASRLCQDLKAQGYDIEIRVLAVPKEDSMQGVYRRYERPKAEGMPGRWVPERIHDESYDGLVKSVRRLEREGHADNIQVYNRGADEPGLVHTGAGAADALERERNRERTADELATRDRLWNNKAERANAKDAGTMQCIYARDPKLAEPENRRAAELAAKAREQADASKSRSSGSVWSKHTRSLSAGKETIDRGGIER